MPGLQTFLVDDSADVLEECAISGWKISNAVHVQAEEKTVVSRSISYQVSISGAVPDLERFWK